MEIFIMLIALALVGGLIAAAVGIRKIIDRHESRKVRPLLGVAEDTESLERRFEKGDL